MNLSDRLRFAYDAAKAKAELRPLPGISRWAEKRAKEKERKLALRAERDFLRAVAEIFEEDSQ